MLRLCHRTHALGHGKGQAGSPTSALWSGLPPLAEAELTTLAVIGSLLSEMQSRDLLQTTAAPQINN